MPNHDFNILNREKTIYLRMLITVECQELTL
jgi:hypothetical protein